MDVQLDVSSTGYAGRLELIEGPSGRRQRSDAEKARIVAESLAPGVRVAEVARKYRTTRWQIYDWRKRLRAGRLALPACSSPPSTFAALVVEEAPKRGDGGVEIALGEVVIRAVPGVDGEHLSAVIRAVRAAR